MSLHVMIIGAGRVGSALAHNLVADGHDVVVIDRLADRQDWLAAELPDATLVVGDGPRASPSVPGPPTSSWRSPTSTTPTSSCPALPRSSSVSLARSPGS